MTKRRVFRWKRVLLRWFSDMVLWPFGLLYLSFVVFGLALDVWGSIGSALTLFFFAWFSLGSLFFGSLVIYNLNKYHDPGIEWAPKVRREVWVEDPPVPARPPPNPYAFQPGPGWWWYEEGQRTSPKDDTPSSPPEKRKATPAPTKKGKRPSRQVWSSSEVEPIVDDYLEMLYGDTPSSPEVARPKKRKATPAPTKKRKATPAPTKKGKRPARRVWSRSEVETIIDDYLEMLEEQRKGGKPNKARHIRSLISRLDARTRGSIEYKYRNISAILDEERHEHLGGYRPLHNYQALLKEVLLERIKDVPSWWWHERIKDVPSSSVFGPDPNLPQVIEEPETQEETGPDIEEPEPDGPMAGAPWSEDEIHHAVEAYWDMLRLEAQGKEYDKGPLIKMLREGLGDSPGPLSKRSRQEIKRCMMSISSVLNENFIEHVASYRPITDMDEHDMGLIKDKLIEFGLLEKYSPSPKKSKASKKTNKTSNAKRSRDFMRSFVSPEAKDRYTTNPKPRKDHSGKMHGQSELAGLGYTTQQSEYARRIILKRAVPALGLKKVVDTIIMNVKRSKTRQNPPINAINRWESDLEWLKKNFWKQQFKWPNYRRFGR